MLLLCLEPGQTALNRDSKGGQWLACWLATYLTGWLPDWLAEQLDGQLDDQITGSFVWFVGLLAGDATRRPVRSFPSESTGS